ncbi:hypothetical protein [Kaarinaea lacus]
MNYENLTVSQRLNRILLGAAMIVFTMLTSATPLGWLAILPLLATYPVFAGIYGTDPVVEFTRQRVAGISRAINHLHISDHRSRHV